MSDVNEALWNVIPVIWTVVAFELAVIGVTALRVFVIRRLGRTDRAPKSSEAVFPVRPNSYFGAP